MKKMSILINLLLVMILVGPVSSIQAGQSPPEPSPPRPLYDGVEGVRFLHLNRDLSRRASLESLAPARVEDWSKVVFQSDIEGNWEIYTVNGNGTNQVRRTYHIAADVQPRLNRGCTRIVFASDRAGNYDLYTMNFDGTGLTQLTSNSADDVFPFWSLDGTRIAFQSYRDGQAEIYVMNADGSGQTRLTSNSGYDGMPTWSPDGTKIAFVSDRSGGYRIWRMNSDGSGESQISYEPYAAHPAWSPDSSQIAYDSDADGDGWQELWLMDADGSGHRQVLEAWRETCEIWAGGWSPDGQWVAFTEVCWTYELGQWRIDGGHIRKWHSTADHAEDIIWETSFRPDWHTADLQPPTSSVYPLPAYWRGTPRVRWSGSDIGIAGIKWYDIQVKDTAGGSWTDWETETADTYSYFVGTPGHTYYFRSRATDDADNVEEWPAGDGDAHVTLYSWAASGTVRDNRGIPVAQATISTTPSAFEVSPTDPQGHYVAYVGDSAITYTVEWARSGYGVGAPAVFPAASDAQIDAVLPPPDNVVQNWGFERGNLGTGDWQAGGVIAPTVTDTVKHTGGHAALLGQSLAFAPPVNVSNSSADSYGPQVAVDGSGTVHMIWVEGHGLPDMGIYYAQGGSGTTWSSPQEITSSPSLYYFDLVADGSGAIHVVWVEEACAGEHCTADIFYTRRGNDGTWSSPAKISNNPPDTGPPGDPPQLVAGPRDTVHIVWTMDGIDYAYRGSDGTWSSPVKLADRYYPTVRLAVDGKDAAHVVWDGFYTGQGSDGTWRDPESIPAIPGMMGTYRNLENPHLTVDRDGVVHVVGSLGDIYYTRREIDGSWSFLENISNSPGGSGWWAPTVPQLAVDRSGTVHVAWMDDTSGHDDLYYSRRGSSGMWSIPEKLTNMTDYSIRSPQMVVEGDGTLHVVWAENDYYPHDYYYIRRGSDDSLWSSPHHVCSGYVVQEPLAVEENRFAHVVCEAGAEDHHEIYYAGPALAEQTGDSNVSQVVTVPISMSNPTLSFLYQLAVSDTLLNVHVDDGTAAIPLLSTTADTDVWTHHWSDLSPWAGQTITLSFGVHETEGHPGAWAYLDEVTVGSAYADLWINKGSVTALPGEETTYWITYGNRGGGAADDVIITDTLPSELSLTGANPPPVFNTMLWAWEWDMGDLAGESGPFSIHVTATVAPTATVMSSLINTVSIGSASGEIEIYNNVAYATVFVGRRVYLPVIVRGS